MRNYPLDIIQVDYSIGNRDSEAVLKLAQERKIAVMANVPLGGRRGATEGLELLKDLPAWAAEFDCTTPAQFLLKFVVSHPAITVAVPGTRRVAHVEDNNAAARGKLPDEAMRTRMAAHYDALPRTG
jgi:aryl-alcohol dehydrogenase-like predicted oxidoreductase